MSRVLLFGALALAYVPLCASQVSRQPRRDHHGLVAGEWDAPAYGEVVQLQPELVIGREAERAASDTSTHWNRGEAYRVTPIEMLFGSSLERMVVDLDPVEPPTELMIKNVGDGNMPIRSAVRVFERSGHNPQLEEQELFDDELLRWLVDKSAEIKHNHR